ncbi:threonine--tRNA ligase [Robbsia sp. KACC 23696]|uniref:threonine--tRNA ligase n=1 Tax=Robbsia sp. KACC 23696 TaxID=3149231 RepID=UPI00325C08E7
MDQVSSQHPIAIALPDGSQRIFDQPVTVAALARDIGPELAKVALAGKIDGRLVELDYLIDVDANVEIVTDKHADALSIIRHSCAHLMAQAIARLHPDAQFAMGPAIDDGFYYDIALSPPLSEEDLPRIEAEMHAIVAEAIPVSHSAHPRDDAVRFFSERGQMYKAQIAAELPADQLLTIYRQGEFADLCRGPHVPNTRLLRAFKLMKTAGAYWRGDANNVMLCRVYGTAWLHDDDLRAHLHRLKEAQRRDHRTLGKQLDYFHMQDEAPGMVFWHPRGWRLWQTIEHYMRHVYIDGGYQEVKAPQVVDLSLWKRSGHWDNYKDNMFFTASENREYALKPMNCPGHIQIFKHGLRSYRALPIRYGEFGACHRDEPSGALHGIMRVRAFTQDDGHIFCTEEQIEDEVAAFHRQAMRVYRDFGFDGDSVAVKIALRPARRLGSDDVWDRAENTLRDALRKCDVQWEELPGEGAFYSPKIEYHLKDAIGREWQVGTIQADYLMPEKLGAEYVDVHSERRTPVMLHRAIVGSMERFTGILIEHYAGQLPVWLAPIQAIVLNVTDAQQAYAADVHRALLGLHLRVEIDTRNEKIGYKVREHVLQKLPYLLVVGERERAAGVVSVRTHAGQDLGTMTLDAFADHVQRECPERLGR